ncbi:hypothetical protein [Piscinibacter terrae]|uniref:Uncharacterized protein n=1 Tax=Piscinibacter terrae TaxID=2496871 RepID=A0A3N7K546_9BURK|nr:hypothetical protein [Albitalea terrae]RQP26025.1 hypothetical protein DZC73_02950 [Albitalea terrae]
MYPLALTLNGLAIIVWPLIDPVPQRSWIAVLVLMAVFTLVAGRGVTGVWRGALIDERNVISLSRFQMALWTVLILSAFFCAAMSNIAAKDASALSIAVPHELWALMGISATSLVASPLILSNNKQQALTLAAPTQKPRVNASPDAAQWSDLFKSEQEDPAKPPSPHLDLTRIQMFFFTLVTVVAYASLLWTRFGSIPTGGLHELPVLDSSMVTLLGISHTGYLVAKAVPRAT